MALKILTMIESAWTRNCERTTRKSPVSDKHRKEGQTGTDYSSALRIRIPARQILGLSKLVESNGADGSDIPLTADRADSEKQLSNLRNGNTLAYKLATWFQCDSPRGRLDFGIRCQNSGRVNDTV